KRHKPVLTEQQPKWQRDCIKRYRNERCQYACHSATRLQRGAGASQQCLLNKVQAIPSRRGNYFKRHSIRRPYKSEALFHFAPEKVLVFANPEFSPEGCRVATENFFPEQDVSGSRLWPLDPHAGRIDPAIVESALDHPSWRSAIEVPFDRPEHPVRAIFLADIQ